MPQNPDFARVRADAEALDWIVALQETPDDTELRARFEEWCLADPANAAAWQESAQVYAGIGETVPVHAARWQRLAATRKPALAPSIAALRKPRHAHPAPSASRQSQRRRRTKVAVPAAVAAMLAIVAAPELALRWQADVVAATGALREVRLADGTHASLYPGSAIRIAYSPAERRIEVLRGQAWFEVRDEARPFRVAARDVETTDIGTAFEVGLADDDIHVGVGHGIVRVDDTHTGQTISARLTAGHWLSIGQSGQVRQATTSPELIGAWRDGQFPVQDRPMADVIAALRPWYAGMIVVRSDTLARKRVTGVYDLRDPAGAMEALARAYGGRVTRITPWLLILSDG